MEKGAKNHHCRSAQFVLGGLLAGLFVLGSFQLHAAQTLGPWNVRLRPPSFGPLNDVTFGNFRFVAVGAQGAIIYSDDAEHWTNAVSDTTNHLNAITWTESDYFLAVGEAQTILTSRDGISWTKVRSGLSGALTSVAFGSGKYIAVGNQGSLISDDTVNWTTLTLPDSIQRIAYGNGRFVGARSGNGVAPPSPSFRISVSINGIDWVQSEPVETGPPVVSITLNRMQFVDGAFYASGGRFVQPPDGIPYENQVLYRSLDGFSWTRPLFGGAREGALTGIAMGDVRGVGERFVGVGFPRQAFNAGIAVFNSADGVTWTSAVWPKSRTTFFKAASFGNNSILPLDGVFVAVGSDNGLSSIWVSLDGVNWGQAISRFKGTPELPGGFFPHIPAGSSFTAIAGNPNAVVAVGTNWVASSTNGVDWQTKVVPYDLNAISWGEIPSLAPQGLFVAGGTDIVGLSQDGFNWTFTPKPGWMASMLVTEKLLLMAQVAHADGLSFSTNGTTWTKSALDYYYYGPSRPAPHLLALGNGRFVANQVHLEGGGGGTRSYVSSDGKSWTQTFTFPGSAHVSEMIFGKGVFLASSFDGIDLGLWTTSDGSNWQRQEAPATTPMLAYGNGRFLAVSPTGQTVVSDDALTWTDEGNSWSGAAIAGDQVRASAFALGTFFVVGDGGLILQSAPVVLTETRLRAEASAGTFRIYVLAPPGDYQLKTSMDLTTWIEVDSFTIRAQTETLIFEGPYSDSSPQLFKVAP